MSFGPVIVYLGLGSNLGDRGTNLDKTLEFLTQRLTVKKVSSVYETEPVGNANHPFFLNMVCEVSTRLEPIGLLTLVKGIESKLGRIPGGVNAPRPIDIDILLYGSQVIATLNLVIPHPRLTERAFVLIPLVEIAPSVMHPVNGRTVKELLAELKEKQGVFKWERN